MNESSGHDASTSETLTVAVSMKEGLESLLRAHICAQDANAERWDFALHVSTLHLCGMSVSDVRWLVAKQFAEHGRETSKYGMPHRTFRRMKGFLMDLATCVVLTPAGVDLAQAIVRRSTAGTEVRENSNRSSSAVQIPHWDSCRRELSVGGALIKRFRVPAQNQELILSAFQEEGWPHHIYDPLPTNRRIDTHVRLHDAINRLNGCQKSPLVRFHGNGAGNGISWELRRPTVVAGQGDRGSSPSS